MARSCATAAPLLALPKCQIYEDTILVEIISRRCMPGAVLTYVD